jgi:hypothetical protein
MEQRLPFLKRSDTFPISHFLIQLTLLAACCCLTQFSCMQKGRLHMMKSILTVLLTMVIGSLPAWAALGDDVSSVNSDLRVLGGKRRVIFGAGYDLHQITMPDGSMVKEFVSPWGKVFGISWQGHSMPDLQQLLGSYMAVVQQAKRTQVVRRRSVLIRVDDVVFCSSGHLRSFRGYAYVPSLVPSDVPAGVVR